MKDLPFLEHLGGYVSLPKGYVCKIARDYDFYTLFNPETNHVLIYGYHETEAFGDSPSDIMYNGHYEVIEEYEPK